MKCSVCGAESGKYPLCRACNLKKEQGLIIKCTICGKWHYKGAVCPQPTQTLNNQYLYDPKKKLISQSEQAFFKTIQQVLPENYNIFPQVNLAAFIVRNDNAKYQNELFRNVDFLITDSSFAPKIVVEINDQTHYYSERIERDKKVHNILEEAGIPILTLWTNFGINADYIKKRIEELRTAPVVRKHNFPFNDSTQTYDSEKQPIHETKGFPINGKRKTSGCYIATCVYGSYDCPQVWTLRRYRDDYLAQTRCGRLFIKLYYAISPSIVKCFGKFRFFHRFFKKYLDKKVARLMKNGYDNTSYVDKS